MNISVFYGSSRKDGNSELLANEVLKGLDFKSIRLQELLIDPIEDKRHSVEGFSIKIDDYDQIIQQMLTSHILVFATPIYWYSMSGTMKMMFDRLSQAIRDTRYPHLKKHLQTTKIIVLAVGGDEPHIKGLPMIQQFHYIFDFLGMSFDHYLLAKGNRPKDVLLDEKAIQESKLLNKWLFGLKENFPKD